MTPAEIMDKLLESKQALEEQNKELIRLGEEKAEAERVYRTALAKELLTLRAHNFPATLINDLARGNQDVANLRLKRDTAESLYDACKERIKDIRAEIEILRSLLVWQRVEYQNSNIE